MISIKDVGRVRIRTIIVRKIAYLDVIAICQTYSKHACHWILFWGYVQLKDKKNHKVDLVAIMTQKLPILDISNVL